LSTLFINIEGKSRRYHLLVGTVYRDVEVGVLVDITEHETSFDDQFFRLESWSLASLHKWRVERTGGDKDSVLVGLDTLSNNTVDDVGYR
jgi:hypothetical protein